MRLRRTERKGYNGVTTSTHGEGPLPVHHYRARVRTMISACFIGVVLALASTQRLRRDHLPATYAVCSRERNAIYTVDLNAPNVQCVVVSNDLIVDRGSVEEIRSRRGDQDTTGRWSQLLYWPWTKLVRSGTKIYYLEPGEAMYPGFADAHAHILCLCSISHKSEMEIVTIAMITQTTGNLSSYRYMGHLPQKVRTMLPKIAAAEVPHSGHSDVIDRTTSYVFDHKDIFKDPSIWIEGQGWDQNVWPNQTFPTAVSYFAFSH